MRPQPQTRLKFRGKEVNNLFPQRTLNSLRPMMEEEDED